MSNFCLWPCGCTGKSSFPSSLWRSFSLEWICRSARFGHRHAVIAVDDSEAALLLERDLFDRGALVVVMAVADPGALALAKAAGLIVIVTGAAPASALDARRLATHEAIGVLERRGVLIGHEAQLVEGEGI